MRLRGSDPKFVLLQGAVEFLVLARQRQQAFDVAAMYGAARALEAALGESPTSEDLQSLADCYKAAEDFASAARVYKAGLLAADAAAMLLQECYAPLLFLITHPQRLMLGRGIRDIIMVCV